LLNIGFHAKQGFDKLRMTVSVVARRRSDAMTMKSDRSLLNIKK
jgi:hypothetical protein